MPCKRDTFSLNDTSIHGGISFQMVMVQFEPLMQWKFNIQNIPLILQNIGIKEQLNSH